MCLCVHVCVYVRVRVCVCVCVCEQDGQNEEQSLFKQCLTVHTLPEDRVNGSHLALQEAVQAAATPEKSKFRRNCQKIFPPFSLNNPLSPLRPLPLVPVASLLYLPFYI